MSAWTDLPLERRLELLGWEIAASVVAMREGHGGPSHMERITHELAQMNIFPWDVLPDRPLVRAVDAAHRRTLPYAIVDRWEAGARVLPDVLGSPVVGVRCCVCRVGDAARVLWVLDEDDGQLHTLTCGAEELRALR